VWILAERQLEGTKPPPFCKTPFMFRFYEQSRINWFFDDITLFKSLNVTPTNDADYMHCLVKERRAGKKSELPRLIVEVGNNIWTSLMEFLYLKGRGWICPVEDIRRCTLPWWSKRRLFFNRVNNCHAKRSRDILKDEEKFCCSFLVF
jgi:hypothetical protein